MSSAPAFDDVGLKLIDTYLIGVETALITAGAPRADRTQVLQDLETQITDMVALRPQPLTEEAVRAVLDTLEPPAHFAAMYTNGGKRYESTTPTSLPRRRSLRLPFPKWPNAAAASAAGSGGVGKGKLGTRCTPSAFRASTTPSRAVLRISGGVC